MPRIYTCQYCGSPPNLPINREQLMIKAARDMFDRRSNNTELDAELSRLNAKISELENLLKQIHIRSDFEWLYSECAEDDWIKRRDAAIDSQLNVPGNK